VNGLRPLFHKLAFRKLLLLLRALCVLSKVRAMRKFTTLIFLVASFHAVAQEDIVFSGLPSKVIERTAIDSHSRSVSGIESNSAAVRIVKVDDRYFWANRNNTEMRRIEDGIYITFWAMDGSGYVRTLNETAREVFQSRARDDQVGQTMYVEHILIGLESITYYGR
jgi:hypothetical protein